MNRTNLALLAVVGLAGYALAKSSTPTAAPTASPLPRDVIGGRNWVPILPPTAKECHVAYQINVGDRLRDQYNRLCVEVV